MKTNETILTITGSDGTGGSGVQADIRTIGQLGGRAASCITSITVQNTLGIQEFHDLPAQVVASQMEAIINDLHPDVVKIGLLRRSDVVKAVAEVLRRYKPRHIVYVPVLRSAQGEELVQRHVYETIRLELLPLCTLVIEPNDLPQGERRHGAANQLASAVAVFLSRGESVADAMLHARTYLQQLPAGYSEEGGRTAELYNQFLDHVERYSHIYGGVAFYADQLNVSPRYLAQVTRRIAQRSPKTIIDEHIIGDVCNLLRTTSLSLKEIADRMGFSSQTHLSRFVRKLKGLSPSQIRREEGKEVKEGKEGKEVKEDKEVKGQQI